MRPIAKLVEAIVELETAGRLSEATKADLIALMAAENFQHPTARISCCFEQMEGEPCPNCRE